MVLTMGILFFLSSFVSDWEKTSLKPYVEMMEKHALGLMNIVRKDKLANGECCDCQNSLDTDRPNNNKRYDMVIVTLALFIFVTSEGQHWLYGLRSMLAIHIAQLAQTVEICGGDDGTHT
jgi:hypothetical protein